MTATEVAFPVGATTQELVDKNGTTYDVSSHTVTRTGEDGAIPILHMNVGTSFNGEILEGGWRKGWDANMDADQAFVAKLDTTNGELDLLGEADVAGTGGYGWINNTSPVVMMDETEIVFSLVSPIDDTGGTADRDIDFSFFLSQAGGETKPSLDDDFLQFAVNVDESGLILRIYKEIGGSNTLLASGYDYTMDTNRGTGDLEATIWRLVFNGKPGTTGATMSVYLKQSDTLANAESATEHEVTGSPFDISDITFDIAYPCFQIYSENTSYFDDASPASSGGIKVKYPQFDVNWGDDTITDDGSVKCYSIDTEILTRDGFKHYNELSLEDEVMTLNPETKEIEYHKPSRKFKYLYKGKMYRFGMDLLVTPDHRMYVKEDRWNDYKIISAEELASRGQGHYTILRSGIWNSGESLESYSVKKASGNNNPHPQNKARYIESYPIKPF